MLMCAGCMYVFTCMHAGFTAFRNAWHYCNQTLKLELYCPSMIELSVRKMSRIMRKPLSRCFLHTIKKCMLFCYDMG